MDTINNEIRTRLFEMQDFKFRNFNASMIPNIDKQRVIGVRTPELRKLSAELAKRQDIGGFLDCLPHEYFEENLLHGFIIERIKDYSECLEKLEAFLPYIDNWAVCDQCSPKVFTKHKDELLLSVYKWLGSDKPYIIRYGIGMLMKHYLDEAFDGDYLKMVAEIVSEEYYVNMMRAWYFATALAKQYESAVTYFEDRKLDIWTHNKAIQKASESYRVTEEHKVYLKNMRRKA